MTGMIAAGGGSAAPRGAGWKVYVREARKSRGERAGRTPAGQWSRSRERMHEAPQRSAEASRTSSSESLKIKTGDRKSVV